MSLFDRAYKLVVGEAGKSGIEVNTNLHIEFTVVNSDKVGDTNTASIVVFNLSDESIAAIAKDDKVIFEAGYVGQLTTLFLGQVLQVSSVREGTTTQTTIECVDGYVPVREGYTGRTFLPGTTIQSMITQIVIQDLRLAKPTFQNGTLGKSLGINKTYQNAVTKAGHSGRILTNLCKENDLTWILKDNHVSVYPVNGSLDIEVLNISADTGMIGSPQKISDNTNKVKDAKDPKVAYKVKTLLNGQYNIGKLVSLKSKFTSGLQRITKVSHSGSFRGADWFSELVVLEGIGGKK